MNRPATTPTPKAAADTPHHWAIDEPDFLPGLKRGDPEAFELLVREQTPRLLALTRRLLGQDQDAADALQDAFIQVFRGIDGFAGDARLSTWIHRITINAALMKLRKAGRRNEVSIESLLPVFDAGGGPPSTGVVPWRNPEEVTDIAQRREMKRKVRQLIDQLPDNYRTVLILRDIEELDTRETAKLLDLPPGAVKTRLHRARLALRAILAPLFERGDL